MEKETKPQRADFVWLYVNDLREEAFHLENWVSS
jgi:hypothetical protein